nr:hypothetical protein [Tanacetum cinerariifolium]
MPEDNTNQTFALTVLMCIENNPTFDAADTSQPACSVYAVGISQVHSSGDPMPNVDTSKGLLVDAVGAHTMAPPNDRIPDTGVSGIQNNSVVNNLPTHVGSSLRQSVPSGQPPEYMHFEACNETCQHYARSARPKFHRCCNGGRVVFRRSTMVRSQVGSTYGRLTQFNFLKFNGDDVNGWLFCVQQFFLICGDDHKTRLKLGKGLHFQKIRDDQHEGEKGKKKRLIVKSSSIPSKQTTDKQVEKQTTGNTVAVEEMNVGLILISELAIEALADKEVINLVSDDEMSWVHDDNYDTKLEPLVEREYMMAQLNHAMNAPQDMVIQDPGDYEFEIYPNYTRSYPSPLLDGIGKLLASPQPQQQQQQQQQRYSFPPKHGMGIENLEAYTLVDEPMLFGIIYLNGNYEKCAWDTKKFTSFARVHWR